jgi:hypothetical protein
MEEMKREAGRMTADQTHFGPQEDEKYVELRSKRR